MKRIFIFLCIFIRLNTNLLAGNLQFNSEGMLYAIRTDDYMAADSFANLISKEPLDSLMSQVQTDEEKKAFWLNIYNAYVLKLLAENSTLFENRNSFYTDKHITVAQQKFSLDDIEHGILRRNAVKFSLGYFNKIIHKPLIDKLACHKKDYRIHFSLNCGAKSCPAVAYYEPKKIEQQLSDAETIFVSQSIVNNDKKEVAVSQIFSWFRGDFGGKKGIKKLLIKHKVISDDSYKITYIPYDWTLFLDKAK